MAHQAETLHHLEHVTLRWHHGRPTLTNADTAEAVPLVHASRLFHFRFDAAGFGFFWHTKAPRAVGVDDFLAVAVCRHTTTDNLVVVNDRAMSVQYNRRTVCDVITANLVLEPAGEVQSNVTCHCMASHILWSARQLCTGVRRCRRNAGKAGRWAEHGCHFGSVI